jgi:tetratricopeptide (TPR) repeat protein
MLLGRAAVLDRADALVDGLREGRGGLLWVRGDAGIGKTTLLTEVGRRARDSGATVLRGAAADEATGAPAFWLWTQVLRQASVGDPDVLLALGGPRARRAADLLERAGLPVEPDGAANRFPLFDGVQAVLDGLAAEFPVVLLLDDLHWADPGSLHLLRFLLPGLASRPVLVVGGWRDHEVAPGSDRDVLAAEIAAAGESWPLSGLAPGDVTALVAATGGQRIGADEAATVVARTAGNPLFVAEMARLAAARGAAVSEMVPDSAQGTIRRRVARLPQPAQRAVTAAAVLGQDAPLEAVGTLAGLHGADLATAVDALLASGLARQVGDRLALSHALVGDAVHDAMPATQRRELHLAAAGLPGLGPAEVAGHLLRALPLAPRGAVVAATEAAARAARDAQAWEDAARLYRQALDLVPADDPARPRLLRGAGAAVLDAGDLDGARLLYREAADLARRTADPVALADAALGFAAGLGGFEVRLVDREQNDLLTEALEALGEGEPALRVHLMSRLAVGLAFTDAAGRIPALADEAVALARRIGDRRALGAALAAHCDAHAGPDHVALREAEATDIIGCARDLGDLGLELLGLRLRVIARWERGAMRGAERDVRDFAALAERLGQPQYAWYVPLWRGLAAHLVGDLDLMERCAEEVAVVGARADSHNAEVLALVQGFWPLIERGRSTEAMGRATAAFGLLPELAPDGGSIIALFYGTDPRVREQHLPHLPRLLDALPRDKEWLPNLAGVVGGLVEGRLGGDEVRYLYAALAPYADLFLVDGIGAAAMGSVEGSLGSLADLVGDHDAAVGHLERAIDANLRIGATLAAANARRALGGVLATRGSAGDAERARELRVLARDFDAGAGIRERAEERTVLLGEAPMPARAGPERGRWEWTGAGWAVDFRDRTATLPAAKGLTDLARLLARPGEEVHVLDLATPTPGTAPRQGDLGDVLDDRARAAYRQRLTDLDERIAEAEDSGDDDARVRAVEERDFLVAELTGAYGLDGRPRRAGDPAERARTTVTSRIRDAIGRVERAHPELGRHLRASVRTGTFCSYSPEHPVRWELGPTS